MEEEKLDRLNNINGRQQKIKRRKELICPLCGKAYSEPPAISRKDNSTLICADCGTRESLEIYGVSIEKQNEIIDAIHRSKESVVR